MLNILHFYLRSRGDKLRQQYADYMPIEEKNMIVIYLLFSGDFASLYKVLSFNIKLFLTEKNHCLAENNSLYSDIQFKVKHWDNNLISQ
jgi:hypothetical protein